MSRFSPEHLRTALSRLPAPRGYWVAYSGGPDSHALLDATTALRTGLEGAHVRAVHVNHRLQRESGEWETHCRRVCEGLRIQFMALQVNARPKPGESPEAAARRARYDALATVVGPDEMLLTAHHMDDQAETVLLQLLRGAGPRGLAAMPACVRFGRGWLGRPLLEWSRAQLQRYGQERRLDCIPDLSNYDYRYDRNYLRQRILPRLRERWPSVATVLARVSRHQAELSGLLDALGREDLGTVLGPSPETLSAQALGRLSPERRRNVLRFWIRGLGLPVPGRTHLEHVVSDVIGARADGKPRVSWDGAEVRRYRDLIYAMRPASNFPKRFVVAWKPPDPLVLPWGRLEVSTAEGQGLSPCTCAREQVTVRFRRGGERCRPSERDHTHSLKKLLQEGAIPPWRRSGLPLIYVGERIAAVADLWVCDPFAAAPDESGWLLRWTETDREPDAGS